MTQEQLLLMVRNHEFDPTILNTADATHYLIGAEDCHGNFYHFRSEQRQTLQTRSLEEAKAHLKGLGINRAVFEMTTPYDEMIGSDYGYNNKTRYVIIF